MLLVTFLLVILAIFALPPLLLSSLERILTVRSLLFAILRMLEIHLLEQFLLEGLGEGLDVHIVAISSSLAAAVDILLALGVQKISDRRVNRANFLAIEETAINVLQSVFGEFLVAVLHIDIAHDVVAQVIHDDHILDLTELTHLFENLFKKGLESS